MGRTKQELLENISKLEDVLDNLPFDVWYKDLDGTYLYVNKSLAETLNRPKSHIVGKKDDEIYPETNASLYVASDEATIKEMKPRFSEALLINGAYSEEYKAPVFDGEGRLIGTTGFSKDITEKKEAEKEILYLSFHDQLTGLYNRRFFEEEVKRLDTARNLPITFVMADVNGLKLVNDAFGHDEGDKLLRNFAQVLGEECRSDDLIARVGGDEFTMLLTKTDHKEAEKIVERIENAISAKSTHNIIHSVSFGFACKYRTTDSMEKTQKLAEDRMYLQKLAESPQMRDKTIQIVLNNLYKKNEGVKDHSHRVSKLAGEIGQAMGMTGEELEDLKIAGLMHDIGKIVLDDNTLNKSRPLNDVEKSAVKRHPEIGYQILRSVSRYAPIAEYVLYHHERPDGTGYPRGLKGDEIPLQSKILSLAEAYDEMINRVGYKLAISEAEAIEEIKKKAGGQFDPALVEILIVKILKKAY